MLILVENTFIIVIIIQCEKLQVRFQCLFLNFNDMNIYIIVNGQKCLRFEKYYIFFFYKCKLFSFEFVDLL